MCCLICVLACKSAVEPGGVVGAVQYAEEVAGALREWALWLESACWCGVLVVVNVSWVCFLSRSESEVLDMFLVQSRKVRWLAWQQQTIVNGTKLLLSRIRSQGRTRRVQCPCLSLSKEMLFLT